MNHQKKLLGLIAAVSTVSLRLLGHEVTYTHIHASTNAPVPLKQAVESTGPLKAHTVLKAGDATPVSGRGYWKFIAAREGTLPLPAEIGPFIKGAHGTIIVDQERDIVYWGLEKVGWVSFSGKLSQSAVVKGDLMFSHGNIHGADLLPRRGKLPLVVSADNVDGEVYLSDTSFQHAEKLDWPQHGPYTGKGEFHPTDAAFTNGEEIYVTDGYGKGFFMPAKTRPLGYTGTFFGGKELSGTPHGITYDKKNKNLIVSARPEAQIKSWSLAKHQWLETMALPGGSTVCDVDIWGDYAIAPCLDGPNKTPGPIYILNIRTKTIVSVIRPKEDLGYTDAQHIHDATWYVTGKGKDRELYILFTNWNPGGIGALKLVGSPDAGR